MSIATAAASFDKHGCAVFENPLTHLLSVLRDASDRFVA